MDIVVTKKYRGIKDKKGTVGSTYNFNNPVDRVQTSTVINNSYNTSAPETTLIAPTFTLVFNFIELISFDYICFADMIIISQESENGDATLSIALDSLIGQYAVLTITPTVLGMVILKGEYKL